ncbi:MAG: hypothetical protein KJ587_06405 [Alphaproteobacteria bacterium]|nr:hypothetical protein [Alphaproteobacteria bacterium]
MNSLTPFDQPLPLLASRITQLAATSISGRAASIPGSTMIGRRVLLIALAILPGAASAAGTVCVPYKVDTGLLNISKDLGGTTYIDVMVGGDKACVTKTDKFEGRDWGYVDHKLEDSDQTTAVEGWAPMRYLKSLPDGAENKNASDPAQGECRRYLPMLDQTVSCEGTKTAVQGGDGGSTAKSEPAQKDAVARGTDPEPKPKPTATSQAPEPKARQTANNDSDRESDELRYNQPVPFGPYPVNGLSLEELIETVPLFAPIEGLPDELWKKSCATCHKWNKDRLCEQGKTYAKSAKDVLRHQHPMGGAFKIALMKWSSSGCN